MTILLIKAALLEADRFRAKAEAVIENEKPSTLNSYDYVNGSKLSGALRRASLDLTRALAEMRKP